MPWLHSATYLCKNPERPEEYEYQLIMAATVDDGFGGQTIAYKPFSMEQAQVSGFKLPDVISNLNVEQMAANDRLKQQISAFDNERLVLQQALDELKEQSANIVQSADNQISTLKEELESANLRINELMAAASSEK